MNLIKFEEGPIATMCYLFYDESTRNAVLIDAAPDCIKNIGNKINELSLNLNAVLLTHSHWDHTTDAAFFAERFGAKIYIHTDDNYRLVEPMLHSVFKLPFEITPINDAIPINSNDNLEFGGIKLKVIHTPGHTEGSVCFYSDAENILFSGDTLFLEGIGRTDLPGGDTVSIFESINNEIMNLPDSTKVLPGHGPSTTIEHERNHNPMIK